MTVPTSPVPTPRDASQADAIQRLVAADQALAAIAEPFHLPLGGLAPVVAAIFAATPRDEWIVAGPRERVGAVLRGCSVERLAQSSAGARPYKVAPCTMAPGTRALHAVGLAVADDRPVVCVLGLASAASGALYEALNAATLTGARVIFVVLAPTLGDDAPIGPQIAARPGALAAAFDLPVHRADARADAVADALDAAHAGSLPALVEISHTPSHQARP